MSNQLKLRTVLGVATLVLPMVAVAATETTMSSTEPQPATQQMGKDIWLQKIKEAVPGPICKGFMEDKGIAERLKDKKISYDDCVALIPPITDKCTKKYYDSIPMMIDEDSASKWGHSLGECIGADFAVNYLYSADMSGGTTTTTPSTTQ